MSAVINKRVFLVGCSRSGTTILQVLIAGHDSIYSFPETFFFIDLNITHIWQKFLPRRRYGEVLQSVMKRISREDLISKIPNKSLTYRQAVDLYVCMLDCVSRESGYAIWLEKSPMHVLYIDEIKKMVPKAHFIHILRDGRDVVASIYDRACKYPHRFGFERNPVIAIDRWNKSLSQSSKYVGISGHSFVLFDKLINNTEGTLRAICADLNIDFEIKMKNVSESSINVIPSNFHHLEGARRPVGVPESKFTKLFDSETQKFIESKLHIQGYEALQDKLMRL